MSGPTMADLPRDILTDILLTDKRSQQWQRLFLMTEEQKFQLEIYKLVMNQNSRRRSISIHWH